MRLWWLTNGETYKISVSYSIYSITVSISLCPALAFHKGVVYCDGGYYHLPFSLCLSRLVGSDTCRGLPLFGYIKRKLPPVRPYGWLAGWLTPASFGQWWHLTLAYFAPSSFPVFQSMTLHSYNLSRRAHPFFLLLKDDHYLLCF